MVIPSARQNDDDKWALALKWLDDNQDWKYTGRPGCTGDFFQLGVFRIGSTGQFELENTLVIKYEGQITGAVRKYCNVCKIQFEAFKWQFTSPDMENCFPGETATPNSLGLPRNGCAIITYFGKMPRKSKPAERVADKSAAPKGRGAPTASAAGARCAVPVCRSTAFAQTKMW